MWFNCMWFTFMWFTDLLSCDLLIYFHVIYWFTCMWFTVMWFTDLLSCDLLSCDLLINFHVIYLYVIYFHAIYFQQKFLAWYNKGIYAWHWILDLYSRHSLSRHPRDLTKNVEISECRQKRRQQYADEFRDRIWDFTNTLTYPECRDTRCRDNECRLYNIFSFFMTIIIGSHLIYLMIIHKGAM